MKTEKIQSDIAIICPSPKGKDIALKLQKHFEAKLYIKEPNSEGNNEIYKTTEEAELCKQEKSEKLNKFNLSTITKNAMEASKGVIFISSTGIAVRAIAPFLKGKDKDPGVVVVDLSSKYAINILSGHLGGGNELTIKIAEILGAQPIITTATDNLGIIAPDVLAKNNNLIIDDLKKVKYIASLLVDGKIVGIKDDYKQIQRSNGYEEIEELRENSIWITHNLKFTLDSYINEEGNEDLNLINKVESLGTNDSSRLKELDYSKILKLIKRDLVLGIGCRRNTEYEKLYEFINSSLIKYNLDIRAVAAIVSVEVKKDEEGIIKLAEKINCPFKTFTKEEIKTVQDKYEKSEFVFKTLGITGVCEPSVDLAGAKVIISKVKRDGMTLAIGVLNNK
ncbi:cobalt-precorrin 5A hydrolase [Clostridium sp. C2-6-12]|uniref:cobalt-precorrin 5A hydrolase n=1 Tax=Clostridium sp. C2-6-12 TaxID=2698832 RepID=UPI0013704B66|nr:cobalt-precorrin 5A hydrolase [Clostridium sp. C2-6-12]